MTTSTVTLRLVAEAGQLVGVVRASNKELGTLGTAAARAGAESERGFARSTRAAQANHTAILAATRAARGFVSAFVSLQGVRAASRIADEYANITAQLKLATDGHEAFAAANDAVYQISQRTSTALSSTANLYARLARSTQDADLAQFQLLKITETINKTFAISGTSAVNQANAITQLTQAFAGGVLRAEEYNSVIENSPRLAQVFADGLGISMGELRKHVNNGTVDIKKMVDALLDQAPRVEAEFTRMPLTIERGWMRVTNSIARYIGQADQAAGTSAGIAQGLAAIANNIGTVVDIAVLAGVVISARLFGPMIHGAAAATASAARQSYAQAQLLQVTAAGDAVFAKATASQVAMSAARVSDVRATLSAVTVARAEQIARLQSADAAIAGAQATIRATAATGSAAAASGFLRRAEAELAAAMRLRSVATTELAVLGRQQLSLTAALTAATNAHSAAQVRAAAAGQAAAASAVAAGLGARAAAAGMGVLRGAMALLGGPWGVAIAAAAGLYFWLNRNKQAAQDLADVDAPKTLGELADQYQKANRGLAFSEKEQQLLDESHDRIRRLATAVGVYAAERDRAAADGRGFDAANHQQQISQITRQIEAETKDIQRFYAERDVARGAASGAISQETQSLNEQTAVIERQLVLMRAGVAAEEAATRAKLEADKVDAAAIERHLRAADALKRHTDQLQEFQRALEERTQAQMDAEILGGENRELARRLALMRAGLTADQAGLVLDQQRLQLDAQIQASLGNREASERALLEIEEQRAVQQERLRGQTNSNDDLRAQLGLMSDVITAEEAAFSVRQRRLQLEAELLRTHGLAGEAALRTAQAEGEALQYQLQARQRLQQFLDQDSFASTAAQIREAFEGIGDPIAGLIDSLGELTNVSQRSAEATAAAFAAAGGGIEGATFDAELFRKSVDDINRKTMREQIGAYGQMAGAAANFFDAGSRGYKALQAASQVFHAAELAMTLAELGPKAVSAILNQGNGDPYSAFGRMAAMAAIVAGLGVATGGIGGGSAAPYQRPVAGTGTVLGDSAAQSQSIGNALEQLVELQDAGLFVSQAQLTTLRAIEAGINGVGSLLYRANPGTGATPFAMPSRRRLATGAEVLSDALTFDGLSALDDLFGGALNKLTGGLIGELADTAGSMINRTLGAIFGTVKAKQVDSGIEFAAQSLGDVMSGRLDAAYYAAIEVTKKKMFGLSKSSNTRFEFADLDSSLERQFELVLSGIGESVLRAATGLGTDSAAARAAIAAQAVDIGRISFEGKSADDVQRELSAAFSGFGDRLVESVLPQMTEFQRTGEGLYETLVRVSSQTAAITGVLDNLGISINAAGDGLARARISEQLIDLAGGIEVFAESVSTYLDNFFTDGEKHGRLQAQLAVQLQELDMALPTARQGIRDLVAGLDVTTDAGQRAFTSLMALSGQLDDYYDALDKRGDVLADAQMRLAQLTMSGEAFAALQLDRELDALRQKFENLGLDTIIVDQIAAAERAAQVRERYDVDALRRYRDQLQAVTAEAAGVPLDAARREFELLASRARLGDADAVRDLPRIGEQLRSASQQYASNQIEYMRDVALIERAVIDAETVAERQANLAAQQYAELETQTGLLRGIHERLAAVAPMFELPVPAGTASPAPMPVQGGTRVDVDELRALVAELRQLRAEVVPALGAIADHTERGSHRTARLLNLIEHWDATGLPQERAA